MKGEVKMGKNDRVDSMETNYRKRYYTFRNLLFDAIDNKKDVSIVELERALIPDRYERIWGKKK